MKTFQNVVLDFLAKNVPFVFGSHWEQSQNFLRLFLHLSKNRVMKRGLFTLLTVIDKVS